MQFVPFGLMGIGQSMVLLDAGRIAFLSVLLVAIRLYHGILSHFSFCVPPDDDMQSMGFEGAASQTAVPCHMHPSPN